MCICTTFQWVKFGVVGTFMPGAVCLVIIATIPPSSFASFFSCILENIMVVARAFKSQFVIPEFTDFCKHINDIYWNCRSNTKGKVGHN